MPYIAAFCITGIFCLNSNAFDLYYTIGFLILGYVLDKNGYPTAPLILGLILGGMVEENLRRSIVYYGSFAECAFRMSVGTVLFAIAVLVPVVTAESALYACPQGSPDRALQLSAQKLGTNGAL